MQLIRIVKKDTPIIGRDMPPFKEGCSAILEAEDHSERILISNMHLIRHCSEHSREHDWPSVTHYYEGNVGNICKVRLVLKDGQPVQYNIERLAHNVIDLMRGYNHYATAGIS
jgi:hypothetical protein